MVWGLCWDVHCTRMQMLRDKLQEGELLDLRGSYLIDVTNGCADVSSSTAQDELCLHSQLQAQVMARLSREGQGALVVSSTCYLQRRRHLSACLAATYVSCFFPFLFFYFFFLFSRQVLAQPGLTLTILLPQSLECWNYSHHP